MQAEVDATQDTEFHDALRAHGIIPPKPPSRSPSPELPTLNEMRTAALKQATVSDLDLELEGELDDEEEKLLEKIRRERMSQLRTETKKARFGRVYPISRPDYTREVTEASKQDPDAAIDFQQQQRDDHDQDENQSTAVQSQDKQRQGGTGVVCFLYKDGMETCRLLKAYLDTLAAKYPTTKFVSIVGDQCIPNYPDRNLPTLLIYRNGELHRQIVGLRPEIGLDGMKTTCQDIELLLTAVGAIQRSKIPGAETHLGQKPDRIDEEDEEEDGEEVAEKRQKSIRDSARNKTQEELDDELDWDL
ncbi:related to phosducin homolog, likely to be involved in regulation of pheromone response [Melanopsichium pennsylvanicum]|uniref:Related to phosducin homolog, likely to be involved in regulation of pheromone response n=2 Tax=Melanopsichium pennsylvanicum TaxID=63383 RepID=A0AAJ4XG87_9BASI|nr:related to phosducin homolog, likely to be involved in regulation of pheromone response [Melanopsichium pennsylvanicum 4]SNX81939.1 related to phosducin homolog, likely to be involved in regulation of pheromone response [Melanopsichium pennsylvanicum]